jgi:hypothetical protein
MLPPSDVKVLYGPADIATTMIYVHYVPQLDAADRLSRALRAVAGVESTSAADALLERATRG